MAKKTTAPEPAADDTAPAAGLVDVGGGLPVGVSSDVRDTLAVTPEMVVDRVKVASVDELRSWAGPYELDLGQAHAFADVFGPLRVALVRDGMVVWGQEFVEAERQQPRNGGRVPVLDITDLEWSETRAYAAAVGMMHLDQLARPDTAALADLLMLVHQEDERLLQAVGFTVEDLDDLLAQLRDGDSFRANGAGGQADPPDGFKEFDDSDVDTEHRCPKCGYEWSGAQ